MIGNGLTFFELIFWNNCFDFACISNLIFDIAYDFQRLISISILIRIGFFGFEFAYDLLPLALMKTNIVPLDCESQTKRTKREENINWSSSSWCDSNRIWLFSFYCIFGWVESRWFAAFYSISVLVTGYSLYGVYSNFMLIRFVIVIVCHWIVATFCLFSSFFCYSFVFFYYVCVSTCLMFCAKTENSRHHRRPRYPNRCRIENVSLRMQWKIRINRRPKQVSHEICLFELFTTEITREAQVGGCEGVEMRFAGRFISISHFNYVVRRSLTSWCFDNFFFASRTVDWTVAPSERI